MSALRTSFVFLLFAMPLTANALTNRDLLHLNTLGEGISDISWCSPDSFTFAQDVSPSATESVRPSEHAKELSSSLLSPNSAGTSRTPAIVSYRNVRVAVKGRSSTDPAGQLSVKMLSSLGSAAPKVDPIAVFQNARISVACLRSGEFVYVDGWVRAATVGGATAPLHVPLAQLIDIRSLDGPQSVRRTHTFASGSFNGHKPLTAADGSVLGQIYGVPVDLSTVDKAGKAEFLRSNLSYSLRQDEISIAALATTPQTSPPRPFPIYGLSAPELWNFGSYRCAASRPGCASDADRQNAVYYLYSKHNTDKARVDDLHTLTPQQNTIFRRWPVSAKTGVVWDRLEIQAVVLDETRCFVLLQPKPWLAANRVNGRLRLDLLIADCGFSKDRLEFDVPRVVAQMQGSFIWPKLSLHGEFLAIAENIDMAAQPEDQADLEREAVAQASACVHIYDIRAKTVVNTICGRLGGGEANRLIVGPDAGFVAIESDTDAVIVGRNYRNDGTGPVWLTHGGRP